MTILLGFAFLAGFATVISPCVLPVLPIILASGLAGGRSRPLGVVLGLVISFSFFTLFLSVLVHATGVSPDWLRYVAIASLALFGCITFSSRLSDWFSRLTQPLAQLGSRIDSKLSSSASSGGAIGGFILGAALGLLWTPCAGPILASVTALAATRTVNGQAIALTAAYAIGFGVPMLVVAYGGQRFIASSKFLSRHAEALRRTFGVLTILTAIGIATHADAKLQTALTRFFPNLLPDNNQMVINKLGGQDNASDAKAVPTTNALPQIGPAPELVGVTGWVNTEPLTLAALRGKVVLIDFWTYSCINCLRTLPYLSDWYQRYKDKGFTIIGVHTPEFEFEKSLDNVRAATKRLNVLYPVALDSNYGTWNAYDNHYWPAHYLIDQKGVIRDTHFGEGNYVETENAIRALLNEKPMEKVGEAERPMFELRQTPETYLGSARASSYVSGVRLKQNAESSYNGTDHPGDDEVSLRGRWLASDESIEAREDGAQLIINFSASRVYLVLDAPTAPGATIGVLLDGREPRAAEHTDDMNAEGRIEVREPRKYDIVKLSKPERHTLQLLFPRGVRAYAFTFGNE